MPCGSPNLDKIGRVIPTMLPHAPLLSVERDIPPAEPARSPLVPYVAVVSRDKGESWLRDALV